MEAQVSEEYDMNDVVIMVEFLGYKNHHQFLEYQV